MRAQVKAAVERALLRGGAAALARRRLPGGALILAYHNIVPAGASPVGDRSLHLRQADFAAQLDELQRSHDIVPLERALATGAEDAPVVAITFDDAYAGAVTAGVAELAKRGLTATIFVAPAFVGGRTFWWDDLTPAGAPALAPKVRERALDQLGGRDAAVREWAARERLPLASAHPPYARVATEAELAAAVRAGMTLASHTWSHPNLTRLDGAELGDELARPLPWLNDRFGAAVRPWITYPYGLESPAVRQAAANAGYEAALRVDGGWVSGGPRFALPRLNVPAGMSREGLALRAAGLFCR